MTYEILTITEENFPEYAAGILAIEGASFPLPWSEKAFRGELRNPVSHFWGVIEGHAIVAYLCFWSVAGEIHVMNVAVKEERRGVGYGAFLLGEMLTLGRAGGMEAAWLEVRPSNRPARRLYGKLGFEEVGRRPLYYSETREDAILMRLDFRDGGRG